MKRSVYIRCDASTQIGLGHLVRCTALAEMLKEKFEIVFFCLEIPESYTQGFKFSLTKITTEDDFLKLLNHQSLVVLDGYHFTSSYQKKIKDAGALLVSIVDLPDQEYFADLLINHSPGANQLDYRVQVYTHFAFGVDYALLRPPFLEQAKKQRVISKIDSAIICFGGSDSLNLTERTLTVVCNYKEFKKVIVVVGPMYIQGDGLKTLIDQDPRIELHRNVDSDQLLQLLLQAQVAIVPASGVLMESLAAGNRIISGIYVENQKLVYEAFKKGGYFIDAGNFSVHEINRAIEVTLHENSSFQKIIDGRSNERLLKKFEQVAISNELILRIATEKDTATTYKWATDPTIRAFSFQQNEIKWDEHVAWFQGKIHNDNCVYFIAEMHGDCIGSIRFDVHEGEAIISYLIDSRFHSMGYGLILLAQSFKALSYEIARRGISIHSLVGYVMFTNYPSIKTFVNLGFRESKEDSKIRFVKTIYAANN